MPKRKRGHYGAKELDPARETELKREGVEKAVVKARKILNKAIKTAKAFERQKLGKRIKSSTEQQDGSKCERLLTELDAVKSLDVSMVVESYLRKCLLKSKGISESALLPEKLKGELTIKNKALSESTAISNVTARIYNMKHVKEATSQAMSSLNSILGIPNPSPVPKAKTKVASSPARHAHNEEERLMGHSTPVEQAVKYNQRASLTKASPELDLDGVDSESEPELQFNSVSRGDEHIPGSSNGDIYENRGEEGARSLVPLEKHIPKLARNSSISILENSRSPSPRNGKRSRIRAQSPTSGSTFLPTLMGGYWSGSELATDDEDAPAPRKNRPGQHARRAMWEEKYGANANHLKTQASTRLSDKDWDPKLGARSRDERGRRRGREGIVASRSRFSKAKEFATTENAMEVKPRARGMGMKDDAGPLHPSWEAAKKAKEAKQNVEFQGKKVVFD